MTFFLINLKCSTLPPFLKKKLENTLLLLSTTLNDCSSLDELKESLNNEVEQWQTKFTNGVLELSKLKYLCKTVSEKYDVLEVPINQLVDARRAITCMKEVESDLMELDREIENTNAIYDLLHEHNVKISAEDGRRLDILNDTYKKLKIKVVLTIA